MSKYKLFKDRIFIYICSLYLVGLFFGIFLIRKTSITINFSDPNFLRIFCSNYWYIFLMWLFGFSVLGLLFNSIIIFFRAFLFGALIVILISRDLSRLGMLILLEVAIFIPAFFTLSYFSLALSWDALGSILTNTRNYVNTKKYLNLIIIETVIIIIYSVVIVIYR